MGLQTMPNRFRAYSGEPWKSRGVRLMPVDKFCVCYIVNHDDLEVYIARVMYGGRNIDEQLHKWAK
jgi:toxin ParE1/3/4